MSGSQLIWGKEGDVISVGGWAHNAFLLESFKRIPPASGHPFQCSSRKLTRPGCGRSGADDQVSVH